MIVEVVVERRDLVRPGGDQLAELPVGLDRQLEAVVVRDRPEDVRRDRATDVDVQIDELASHARRLQRSDVRRRARLPRPPGSCSVRRHGSDTDRRQGHRAQSQTGGGRRAARELKEKTGRVPGLAVIRVGEDPASKIYVTGKQKAAAEVGFHSTEHHFPETASHAEVQARLEAAQRRRLGARHPGRSSRSRSR